MHAPRVLAPVCRRTLTITALPGCIACFAGSFCEGCGSSGSALGRRKRRLGHDLCMGCCSHALHGRGTCTGCGWTEVLAARIAPSMTLVF
eukprot:122573-Prymnesium_polylepis.1